MSEGYTHGHYVLGIQGLALLRAGADRRLDRVRDHLDERVAELRGVADRLNEDPYERRRDLPEYGVGAGYAEWADSYDDPGNDAVAIEQPVVRRLLDELPDGPVLDAACGTGRHTEYLLTAGREVIGVDASEAMLARARDKLPGTDFRHGELTALPLPDASVGGAVCALALSHLPELGPAVAELARVLRPGGRVVISNLHPFATGVLGWCAVFADAEGGRSMIPEYAHLAGDYLAAFASAGLVARRCEEPLLSRAQARGRAKHGNEDAFEDALRGVPAVIVWEAESAG